MVNRPQISNSVCPSLSVSSSRMTRRVASLIALYRSGSASTGTFIGKRTLACQADTGPRRSAHVALRTVVAKTALRHSVITKNRALDVRRRRRRRDIGRVVDLLLWCATAVAAVLAAFAHYGDASPVLRFLGTLGAITLASAVLGRALDQLGGRMRPAAIGTFQAVVGNLPELIICIFALRAGLVTVVQAALIGSVLNLLLLGNGLAYLTGGLRNGTMTIDGRHAKVTRVMLVLLMATLITPAIAVNLGTPAAEHTTAVSYVVAIALLTVFVVSLPFRLGKNADAPPPVHNGTGEAKVGTWPLPRVLVLVAVAGLLIAFEADWLTSSLGPATEA
ncbi:hypothetical protein E1091_17530, partial [Micromonospora fluostatini]